MANIAQRSFTGGELDPALHSRTDLVKYQTGAKRIRNMIVRKSGGVTRRVGSEFCSETNLKYLGAKIKSRKIEFKVASDSSYVLEFAASRIRVYYKGVPYINPSISAIPISLITNGVSPVEVTYTGSVHPSENDIILISGVSGMTEINNCYFRATLVNTTLKTFKLYSLDGTAFSNGSYGTYTGGGSFLTTMSLACPYGDSQIHEFDYAQSIDSMLLTHHNYPVKQIVRSSNVFYLFDYSIGLQSLGPSNVTLSGVGNPGSTQYSFAFTRLLTNGTESQPTYFSVTTGNATLSESNYLQFYWDNPFVDSVFNIYQFRNGIYGLVGVSKASTVGVLQASHRIVGVAPDTTTTFVKYINPFNSSGNYPQAVGYAQQRVFFANTINKPETGWASTLAQYGVFIKRAPGETVLDSDSIEFTLAGNSVNPIQFMVDIGGLVFLTETSEQYLLGSGSGSITPGQINPQAQSYNGTIDKVKPITANNMCLYLGAGSVRELGYTYEVDGYRGDDLTAFAAHLFEKKRIVSWAYQNKPVKVIWAVLSDGTMASMTYIKEQQILAWHTQDMDGAFIEDVCVAREDDSEALYITVVRTIGETQKRYIEKIYNWEPKAISDSTLLDSHLRYDGRNKNAALTVTLSTATTWLDGQTITLTSSSSTFTAGDVGKQFHFYNGSETYRITIATYVSGTVIRGTSYDATPTWARNIPLNDWAKAVNSVSGLSHLEGKKVAIFADGYVVASPLNPKYPEKFVAAGAVTLPDFYAVVHVGLPYVSDLQTLPIDSQQGESIAADPKLINEVLIRFRNSLGGFVGTKDPVDDSVGGMIEIKPRTVEGLEAPNKLMNEVIKHKIPASWENNGSVLVRQVDPAPMEISFIAPSGLIATRRS